MEENENKNNVVNEEEVKQEETKAEETTVETNNAEAVKEESKKDAVKDEIKNETVKTAKEVKEAIKNVDIKKDAKATTGFITEMIKNPLSRLKEIAEDREHKDFKFAILLTIVWMIVCITGYYSFETFFKYNVGEHILSLIKLIIAPLVGLIVMSAIVFIMNKNNKKSFITVYTTITAAKIPTIVARVLYLLTLISSSMTKILSPIASFAYVISTIFTFFGIKALFGEEDNSKFLKTFVIIEAIYFVAYFLISYLQIYI